MNAKLATPDLGSLDDEPTPLPRPDLRGSFRRVELKVDQLVRPGFVTEATLPEPTEPTEVLTIEVPRRLKRGKRFARTTLPGAVRL